MTERASPNLHDLRQHTSLSSIKRSRNSQQTLIRSLNPSLREGFITEYLAAQVEPNEEDVAPTEVEILTTSVGCPNPSDRYMVHEVTGETYRMGCGLQRCPPCARTIAKRIAKAIELAKPTHIVGLSLIGTGGWNETRYRMGEFNRLHRVAHGASHWQCAWHLHENPRDPDQAHAHLFVRGTVDKPLIEAYATKVGFGPHVDAQPIRYWAYGYGLHPLLDTEGMDDAAARSAIDDYLGVNGNRPVHATRGFWLDDEGGPCTQAEAKAAASDPAWNVRVYPSGPP